MSTSSLVAQSSLRKESRSVLRRCVQISMLVLHGRLRLCLHRWSCPMAPPDLVAVTPSYRSSSADTNLSYRSSNASGSDAGEMDEAGSDRSNSPPSAVDASRSFLCISSFKMSMYSSKPTMRRSWTAFPPSSTSLKYSPRTSKRSSIIWPGQPDSRSSFRCSSPWMCDLRYCPLSGSSVTGRVDSHVKRAHMTFLAAGLDCRPFSAYASPPSAKNGARLAPSTARGHRSSSQYSSVPPDPLPPALSLSHAMTRSLPGIGALRPQYFPSSRFIPGLHNVSFVDSSILGRGAYFPSSLSMFVNVPGMLMTPAHRPVGKAVLRSHLTPAAVCSWQFELMMTRRYISNAYLNPSFRIKGAKESVSKKRFWPV
mmetsp:Transcript_9529/g.17945  ORF Transcript_9529/g.17945 Transcript_9529/m.17945 type:complete len:368 (-) Transcript_9529:779-1882(-)